MKKSTNKVTILDIAKELNLSKATISYALNNNIKKVSPSTVKTVQNKAKRMGYSTNYLAKSLRKNRTKNISILLGELGDNGNDKIVNGIDNVLLPDYTAVIMSHTDVDKPQPGDPFSMKLESRKIKAILERRDEGVICQPYPFAVDQYKILTEANVPLVLIRELYDMDGLEQSAVVEWDSGSAAKVAVQHLIDTGFRKIGFIGVQHGLPSDEDRFTGYKEVLSNAGLALNDDWVLWAKSYSHLQRKIGTCLRRCYSKPDAFFALNDTIAVSAYSLFIDMGIRVPDDIAIIGMGDLYASKPLGISTVKEPFEEIGRTAAECLLQLMANPLELPEHRSVHCNELIIRKSTQNL